MTPRGWVAVATGLVAVAASASCTSEQSPGPSPPAGPPTTRTAAPTSTPTQTPTQEPGRPPAPITLALAGDIHFEGVLRDRLTEPATALAPAAGPLAAADLAVVNLETSLGTGGRPEPGKRFVFQAPTSALAALAAAGVDVATMANNHALDLGREPLPAVFQAIDAARTADPPLAVVGLGRDVAAAFRPAVLDVGPEGRSTSVAVLGASLADTDPTADRTGQWAATAEAPGTADAVDPRRLLRAVTAAARTADVVVAYLHWGVQGDDCPSDLQRRLAADLVAAGADVVVGSHTHTLQGDGRLGPGYVAYGLGNHAWYSPSDTGVLTLTVRPPAEPAGRARVTRAAWSPGRIGADGLPAPVPPDARAAWQDDLAERRTCAGFAD